MLAADSWGRCRPPELWINLEFATENWFIIVRLEKKFFISKIQQLFSTVFTRQLNETINIVWQKIFNSKRQVKSC